MKKKPTFCSTCKNHHPQHDDGFEYLDCMLFIKHRDDKGKTSVEIWDMEKKEWVERKS